MPSLLRRSILTGAATLAAVAASRRGKAAQPASAPFDPAASLTYPFSVPPLLYAYEANEPSIDAQTMRLHHDRHHAAYVDNLNAALKDHGEAAKLPLHRLLAHLSELPEQIRTQVRNNGGGHANHTMFWQVMGGKGGQPEGELAQAINRDFKSLADLQSELNRAGAGVFGSGWAMVVTDRAGKLGLVSEPNQDSPVMDGRTVLFGNDVWEHAYYLKYQNRRVEYLSAWWKVLDWPRIAQRYTAARAGTLLI